MRENQSKREQSATFTNADIEEFLGRRGRITNEILPDQRVAKPTVAVSTPTEPSPSIEPSKRTSTKQRKADLEEYKMTFLQTPKIVDRQPVFVSREVRDLLYDIVRRMGERRMSVSGFLENLSRHHLDSYAEELEQWRRL